MTSGGHLSHADMTASPPKILQSSRFKIRKDVLETTQDVIPTSTVLPSQQDKVIHFKVTSDDSQQV